MLPFSHKIDCKGISLLRFLYCCGSCPLEHPSLPSAAVFSGIFGAVSGELHLSLSIELAICEHAKIIAGSIRLVGDSGGFQLGLLGNESNEIRSSSFAVSSLFIFSSFAIFSDFGFKGGDLGFQSSCCSLECGKIGFSYFVRNHLSISSWHTF